MLHLIKITPHRITLQYEPGGTYNSVVAMTAEITFIKRRRTYTPKYNSVWFVAIAIIGIS